MNQTSSKPKMIWVNILFFSITASVTLLGSFFYLKHRPLSPFLIGLTVFYLIATGMSITAGYHRLFSHAAYKAHPWVEFFFLFFGAAAFEQSALEWSSQHRDHHRYVDTDLDPYSIKKGFWYAHIGWLLFWEHTIHYENAPDLQKNPRLMHQHRHYQLWAITSGILVPVLLGALHGEALGAFIFAVCARLVIVHHATFCINSICHMFGRATYDIEATAKDHWLIAFITNGEGYHNFHHRFPSDYRNAIRWYQWDPTKWLISILSFCHLTKDLKRTSPFRILEARLKADQQRVRSWIWKNPEPYWIGLLGEAETRFRLLQLKLQDWELKSKRYRYLIYSEFQKKSNVFQLLAKKKMISAQQKFQQAKDSWENLLRAEIAFALKS